MRGGFSDRKNTKVAREFSRASPVLKQRIRCEAEDE